MYRPDDFIYPDVVQFKKACRLFFKSLIEFANPYAPLAPLPQEYLLMISIHVNARDNDR